MIQTNNKHCYSKLEFTYNKSLSMMEKTENSVEMESIENVIVKPEPMEEPLDVDDPLDLGDTETENLEKVESRTFDNGTSYNGQISDVMIHEAFNEDEINGPEMDITNEYNIMQTPFFLESYFRSDNTQCRVQTIDSSKQNSEEKKYSIYDYNVSFDTENQSQEHLSADDNFSEIKCNNCNKNLDVDNLQLRTMAISCQNVYSCDSCRKSRIGVIRKNENINDFMSQRGIIGKACKRNTSGFSGTTPEIRKRIHNKKRCYACKNCPSTNPYNLQQCKKRRNKSFSICKDVPSVRSKLSSKMILGKSTNIPDNKLSRNFKCQYCDVAYSIRSTLIKHVREKHKKDKQKYVCKLCRKDFSSQKCYDNHMNFHQIAKNYVCNGCSLAFLSKFELEQHMKVHDSKDKDHSENVNTITDSKIDETNNFSDTHDGLML